MTELTDELFRAREKIAKSIYDWGFSNEWWKGSNKVWNFVDDAEPEKDGSRDLAGIILTELKSLGYLSPSEVEEKVLEERERMRQRLLNRLIPLPLEQMKEIQEKPASYIRLEDLESLFKEPDNRR